MPCMVEITNVWTKRQKCVQYFAPRTPSHRDAEGRVLSTGNYCVHQMASQLLLDGTNWCCVFSENKPCQCPGTEVVSSTARLWLRGNGRGPKKSGECGYLGPWRRRPRWIHFAFPARSDGGERCEVGVSLPHLSQFLLLHLEETEHTPMLLRSTSAHSAALHRSRSSTWELWKVETLGGEKKDRWPQHEQRCASVSTWRRTWRLTTTGIKRQFSILNFDFFFLRETANTFLWWKCSLTSTLTIFHQISL